MQETLKVLDLKEEVLNNPTKKVTNFGKPLNKLIHAMLSSMKKEGGIGLAANQIGQSVSMFVTSVDMDRVFINPKVVSTSDALVEMEEGCLSNPGNFVKITRPESVVLQFQGPNRRMAVQKFDGLLARVILHELEHLEGKNYLDNVSHT